MLQHPLVGVSPQDESGDHVGAPGIDEDSQYDAVVLVDDGGEVGISNIGLGRTTAMVADAVEHAADTLQSEDFEDLGFGEDCFLLAAAGMGRHDVDALEDGADIVLELGADSMDGWGRGWHWIEDAVEIGDDGVGTRAAVDGHD